MTLVLDNLDKSLREKLAQRARLHGRSIEDEARDILLAAVLAGGGAEPTARLGSWCLEQFTGEPREQVLEDAPDHPPRPVNFE